MEGAIPELRASSETAEAAQTAARAAGLRYVSDRDPGITRIKTKTGFRYLDARTKQLIKDDDTIARIKKLAIPPAYKDVWICAHAKGHLQATGIDARGRKQYRYHAQWRSARDGSKFERMIEFGEALPKLRRKIKRDLALPGLPRDKVLAVLAALLDSTLIRVGNVEYARSNNSFGLTTLRDRHVQFVRDGRAMFRFRAKGGIDREVVIGDRRLARIVRRCRDIPGQQLFQYLDDNGQRHGIDSGQVNDYLRVAFGVRDGDDGFTAKDFRTWGGTLRAIALMGCTPLPDVVSERALTSCVVSAIKQVASELGNTPAVCKKSYINPVVFEAWRDGGLHKLIREDVRHAPRKAEKLALSFLRSRARSTAKKR